MTENLRKQVKLEIQSLLCTEKAAIPSRRLYGLYMSEIGTPIPYVELGYKYMDDLLKSMPDVVSSYTNAFDGVLYVKAVPLEDSSHINELVSGQRTSKPKKKKSNGYSINSKFRGFRVSPQVAPNRNFNKNYNSVKPEERYEKTKTENIVGPTSNSISDNSSNFPPRFRQLNPKTSLLGAAPSSFQVKKPGFSVYNHTGLFNSMSQVASNNNYNINNNMNSTPVNKPQELPGRAHLTPQLMQPRTPVISEPKLEKNAVVVPLNLSSNTTPVNKPQGLPGHAHMTPQLMQPRTPVHQTWPDTVESYIVSPTPSKVILPNPTIVEPPNIDPIQKSLTDLNISRLEEPKSVEQDSFAQQPYSSTSHSQQFYLATGNRTTNSNYFQWKQVEPKPVQASVTPAPQQFKPPGAIQPSTYRSPRTVAENELLHLPEPRPIQHMQPATLTFCPKLPDSVLQEPSTPQKSITSARAPRVLLKNTIPIVSASPSSRQFVYRPDKVVEFVPATLPSNPTPRLPLSPSPLLSRRLPYRSSDLQSVPRAVVNNVTPRPRPTAPSDRLAEFYCERLKTLVTTHNLGKVTLNHNQLKTGRFVASIKVGQDMFITYPKDFQNLTDAYEDAAKQAVIHFEATPIWMQPI